MSWGIAGFAADVVLDFNVASNYTGTTRLNAGSSLVFDFTITGDGTVEMQASTSSGTQTVIDAVTNWNGGVGSVADASLFGQTFQLTASGFRDGSANSISLDGYQGGQLGVYGQNASRVDGATLSPPHLEKMEWKLADGDLSIELVNWVYTSDNNTADVILSDANTSTTNWNLANRIGTNALDGFSLSGSELFGMTEPVAGSHGFGMAGLAFDVIPPVPDRTNNLPNVVVILADDLGYSDISYNPYHGPEVSTPNIDQLIRGGVWFSDAYASGNICATSRAGFMAGCYQQRISVHHEVDVNSAGFVASEPFISEHLSQSNDGIQDYANSFIGKWHMGRDRSATVSVDGNNDGDFIDYGTNTDPIQADDYGDVDPATTVFHPMNRKFDEVYGFINLGGQSYWDYEMGFYEDYYRHNALTPVDGIDDGDAVETYLTTRFTDKACEFIEEQSAADKPFYVQLSYNAVHTPMEAPSSPAGLSEGDEGWFPDAAWFNANYPNMWKIPSYEYTAMTDADKQSNRAILMAMLYHMDEGIGRVVKTLKDSGEWENTIVVFWSDNGGSQASVAANDPLRERKHFNYEGGVRVPMCISWPGGLGAYSNTVVSAPIMSIDILPTVLDAAQIEPVKGFDALDGKSLLPLIRGETDSVHDALFWSEGGETGEYAVRSGDWKLYMDEDVFELYNLAGDIGETIDLAEQYPEKVRKLHHAYYDWIMEMTVACGDDPDDRMWVFETPIPTVGPANMVIEEFDYPVGSLGGAGGGSGWISAWNGSGDMRVQANSLSFPNAYYNNGGANGCSANDETSVSWFTWTRTFAEPLTDSTVWVSFLSSWDPDAIGVSPYLGPGDNAWQSFLINGDTADNLTMFGGNGNRWCGAFDDYVLVDHRGAAVSNLLVDAGSVFTDEHATYLHLIKMETNVSGNNDRLTWYVTSNTNGLTGNSVADLEYAVTAGTLKKLIATSSDGDWWGDSLTGLGIEINNTPDSHLCDISFDNIRVVYGLDDEVALQALLNGDTGELGSLPVGYALRSYTLEQGQMVFEHDEKNGWYPGTAVYESTDSLTNSWQPVSPTSVDLADRYLDLDTYRVRFPTDDPQRYYRIKGE